jgi:hypothetical protein
MAALCRAARFCLLGKMMYHKNSSVKVKLAGIAISKETSYGLGERGTDRNFVSIYVSRMALVAIQVHNLCPPGTLSIKGKASRALS